jgi:hypothetical protein
MVSSTLTVAGHNLLRILPRWAGRRVARIVALFYFAGVLMPSIALAFGDGAAAYCFDEIAEQVAALQVQGHVHEHVHVHSDGTVHHHADKAASAAIQDESLKGQGGTGSKTHSHDANCCGMFGFSAVLPALSVGIAEPAAYQIQQPILSNCLVGCSPGRINRPPIALLPM